MIQMDWIKRSYGVRSKRTSILGEKCSITSIWEWITVHHFDFVTGWQGEFFFWLVCLFVFKLCLSCFPFIIFEAFLFILQDNFSKFSAIVIKTRSSGIPSLQNRALSHIKHTTGLLPHKKIYNVSRRNLKTQLHFYG